MILSITGPTSTGKTKLSVMLAKKYNAIIINADATSVYEGLDIGSAKVTKEEMEGVKHYLVDVVKPDEDYSVYDFQKAARKIIAENSDKNIIVVGGTGLYLKALFYDYRFEEKQSKNTYEDLSTDELYALALKKDKDMNIHKNNRVRLINFLNNDNLTNFQDELLYNDVVFLGLTMNRDKLYENANKRVIKMVENGLIEEVRELYSKYPNSNILKRAIGYKEVIEYLNNNITEEEMIELIQKNTRHFIKRQYTWFNNKMSIKWFETNVENFNETYESVVNYIEGLNSK